MMNTGKCATAIRICVASMLLCVCVHVANAQANSSAGTQAPSLPQNLSPQTRELLQTLADSLRASGLPVRGVYSKAAEGVLKGASESRIVAAVRALAADLATARTALGASATDVEIEAGAGAIHAGAAVSVLKELAAQRTGVNAGKDISLALPLLALTDLVVRGVPVESAAGAIRVLAESRAGEAAYTALRAGAEQDLQAGKPVGRTIMERARSLSRGGRN